MRRYRPEDEDDLFALRRSVFATAEIQTEPSYLRWQMKNPVSCPDQPHLFLYRADGRVVGQQAGIPVTLKIGGSLYQACWACDLMVEPAYRFRGIGTLLSERHQRESDVTMGLSISDQAQRAYRAAGWTDLGTLPLFFRPLDLGRLVSARAGATFGALAAALTRAPLGLIDRIGQRSGLSLARVERFDDRADRVWDVASGEYPVICRRGSAYLNWRYADYPHQDRYRLFHLMGQGGVLGWTVLRLSQRRTVTTGHIVDYLCPPELVVPLFAEALRLLRSSGAAVAYCRHESPAARRALGWLGFIRRESGCRMMFKSHRLPAEAEALLADSASRFVTAGDSDADHLTGDESLTAR